MKFFKQAALIAVVLLGTWTLYAAAKKYSMSFEELSLPRTAQEKADIRASKSVQIDGENYKVDYHPLVKTGEKIGGVVFGTIRDKSGKAMKYPDGSDYVCHNGSGPDHSSFLEKGGNLFLVSQMECGNGGVYVTKLKQSSSGNLSVDKGFTPKWADFSKDYGTYVGCAGSRTPWGNHLGSEEYEPDMALVGNDGKSSEDFDDTNLVSIAEYNRLANRAWKDSNRNGKVDSREKRVADMFKKIGYYMGYITEVSVDANGNPTARKHYSMGRFAHELAYVMPDQKTVYLSDDGQNVSFFLYVADKAANLSSGTLYAAKWKQTSSKGGGAAKISWVRLGHASDAEIKNILRKGIRYQDIFTKEISRLTAEKTCNDKALADGFRNVNTYNSNAECLRLNKGQEKAAAFLEARRYAAYLGATTEFNKEEGITYNPDDKKLYVAMSTIEKAMEDNSKRGKSNNKYDVGGNNHIRLSYNKCGAVYEAPVKTSKDSEGNAINSSYVVVSMKAIIEGQPLAAADADGNKCALDKISNPDNLTYLPKYKILIIGEDTSNHLNDMIWAADIKRGKKITRIFTAPAGSETTSPYWYPNINNFGYMMGVVQHPFGESGEIKGYTPKKTSSTKDIDEQSSVIGYFGPFPSLD